jgi:hypothetical protein
VQNRHLVIDVHALGQTWTMHAYWCCRAPSQQST